MFKHTLCIIGFALVISACNLMSTSSSDVIEGVTSTPEVILDANSLIDVVPSLTPIPTSTDVETIPDNIPFVVSSSCVPNTDLPVYSVRSGDTLFSIALEVGYTTEELAQLNCLEDTDLITTGQKLYIPNATIVHLQDGEGDNSNGLQDIPLAEANNATSIDVANIPLHPVIYHGSIIPSSWITNYSQAFIDAYIVEENVSITFTWSDFPMDLGVTDVGFVMSPNNKIGGYTLIGTDSNLQDGVGVSWVIPSNTQIDVFAVGKIAGQQELIVSESIRVGSRSIDAPLQERVQGTINISPTVIFNSLGDVVVNPNADSISIEWIGVTANYGYYPIGQVFFYHQDTNGNVSLIGTDANHDDGISVIWESFPIMAGVIYAEGEFIQIGWHISQVMLTMPSINVNIEMEDCMFFGYGIGAPHPVYPSPDRSTIPIAEIQEIVRYPVIEQGELFHHIDLGDQSGWIDSGRGELVGDC